MNIINFKAMPLRRKVTLTAVMASSASLLTACLMFIANERMTFPSVLVKNLTNVAQIIGGNSTGALTFNDAKTAQDSLNTLKEDPHILTACLYDGKGQVFVKYASEKASEVLPPPVKGEGSEFSGGTLKLYHEIKMGNDRVGVIYLESDMKEMDTRLSRYTSVTLVVLLLSFVISFLVAQRLQRHVSDPLQDIIEGLSGSARQVASGSAQISISSQQLAEGAGETASSLEETSSSLEEMASMTRQNADNATRATQFMKDTKDMVFKGNEAVTSTVRSMREMQESADKVSRILKTIEEIAFQTNLLALNAAVEAARAGEHGRGFAVVAEEVRSLAQRSASAAKDTAALVDENGKRVSQGVKVSEEAGKALSEIVNQAGNISSLILDIASASQEQSKGIAEVNNAVAQMDKVTQLNSANAEEMSSSSEELSGQAQSIRHMVDQLVLILEGEKTSFETENVLDSNSKKKPVRMPEPRRTPGKVISLAKV